jgi:hypothetical protein
VTLWADSGYNMSTDWDKVMVDVCGTEQHSEEVGRDFLPYGR